MEFELIRTYYPDGTNGKLTMGNVIVAHTIELPWLQNQRDLSCIPEGSYCMERRYSEKFKNHLIIHDVPERAWILIHAANNAHEELSGCIAPVSQLTGIGKGVRSKAALQRILDLAFSAEFLKEEVRIKISS